MIATTAEEKQQLRAAGQILSGVLFELEAMCKEGRTTAELDLAAEHAIRSRGAVPSFLNYQPKGAIMPYPAALCVSINDEVVHGIPGPRVLSRGDVVSLDLGLSFNGFFVDSARTLVVGEGDSGAEKLLLGTREALDVAIAAAKVGAHTGDIGAAVSRTAAKYQLGIVKDLGGHGVGRAVHEKPYIDNEGNAGEGDEIKEGMVLAIEPMLSLGKGDIVLAKDNWTYTMRDRMRAAHFEATVIMGKDGAEVITPY
jgi:methionyl aminopeptidase